MQDDLFKALEDYRVYFKFYECSRDVSIEEIYQAFKKRLSNELCAESHSIPKFHFDALHHYIVEHEFDIEMEENDFGTLKGMLDFMRLVDYEAKD